MSPPRPAILIVDDEAAIRSNLSCLLEHNGYEVDNADGYGQALALLRAAPYDLMIADVVMPDGSGLDLIPAAMRLSPSIGCLVMTGYGTIDMAAQAMQMGAWDFLVKPYMAERVQMAITKALERRQVLVRQESRRKKSRRQSRPHSLIGSSPAFMEMSRLLSHVTETDSTILILGESGTGKELVARALHDQHPTRTGPFVPVNCSAIPDNLIESELFGHEKGAFTDAVTTRIGRFEAAHQGTLFLDEVGELNPATQATLLRVLQEQSFERVGGTRTIAVDVRIIAATNRDLEAAVEERRFREDLYYRLNVIPISVPPLRVRLEDLPILIQHFLDQLNPDHGAAVQGVAPEAMDLFMRYRWPGNIRELENLVERIVVLKQSGQIEREDVPARMCAAIEQSGAPVVRSGEEMVFPSGGLDLKKVLNDVEGQLILHALALSGDSKLRASKLLNINRTTLVEKMKKRGIL